MTPVNKRTAPIEVTEAAGLVNELAALAYFPQELEARIAIAHDLVAICPNVEEARWLVARFRQLFARWPGTRELRAVYCSRNRPRDGFEINSVEFLDGVPTPPPGSELAWLVSAEKGGYYPLPESVPILQLPPGHVVTEDLILENELRRLAAAKDLNRKKAELVRNPNFKPVTQADINRAVEENRDRKAREELGMSE